MSNLTAKSRGDFAYELTKETFAGKCADLKARFEKTREGAGDKFYKELFDANHRRRMKAAPVGDYQRVYGVAVDVRGMAFEAFIKRKKNSHYADEAEQAIAFTLLKEAGMPNRHGTDDAVLKLKDAVPIPARFGDRSGIAVQLRLTDDGTSYPRGIKFISTKEEPPKGIINELFALYDETDKLVVEALRFYRGVMEALTPIKTVAKLQEAWPEIHDDYVRITGAIIASREVGHVREVSPFAEVQRLVQARKAEVLAANVAARKTK